MDSRRILEFERKFGKTEFPAGKDADVLQVLIDSKSFDENFDTNPFIKRLLLYHEQKNFEFLRTPFNTSKNEIDQIIAFQNDIDHERGRGCIDIVKESSTRSMAVTPAYAEIDSVAEEIFGSGNVTEERKEKIWNVFVQSSFNNMGDKRNIFVTEDKDLLNRRRWYEYHFPGETINIVTVNEAIEVLDLFLKIRSVYLVSPLQFTNETSWNWYSFRSKIPHYHVQNFDDPLNGFATRFVFALKSIDEMGMQYYSGAGMNTGDNLNYHFNYFIGLVTGIFDSLALHVYKKYNISFSGDENKNKISLRNTQGKDFLREVRNHNTPLREHITQYVDFIKLIFELRNPLMHGIDLPKTELEDRDDDGNWKANLIKINDEIKEIIHRIGDQQLSYDPISKWGVKSIQGFDTMLSPYTFSKIGMVQLIKFSDTFLEKIGFDNFVYTLNANDRFRKTVESFEKESLGFENSLTI